MEPAPSILSVTANHVKTFLGEHVKNTTIDIGPPADTADMSENAAPTLNLFFYRYETSGFYSDTTPGDPFLIRAHCLISAMGHAQDMSDGELALRLLGHVMQAFHEYPIQKVAFERNEVPSAPFGGNTSGVDPAGIDIVEERPACTKVSVTANLQVIFKTLSLEEINQIWSTQGDVVFKSALAYEFALLPIYPCKAKEIPERRKLDIHLRSSLPTSTPPVPRDKRNPDVWPPT